MSYVEEYQTVLQRIDAQNPGVRSLRYFVNAAAQWHARFEKNPANGTQEGKTNPVVVVLGHGIPEQLVRACGVTPYHLLGGSHASCAWSDDAMPRDSDPASRSMLGYALRLAAQADHDPLFVVPAANDNLRKIGYLLGQEGHEVLSVDIPSVGASAVSWHAWEHATRSLVRSVGHHVGRRASASSLAKADQLVGAARSAMVTFERICTQCKGALSDEARLLVQNTYYQTDDLAQWTAALHQLSAEVQARYRTMGRPTSSAPRVLVMGSPILFPQYKVPALIHDAGLVLQQTADAASTSRFASLSPEERRGGTRRLMRAIAHKHYALDSSSAHVVNRTMEQYVEHLLATTEVDGIVCHILKGQIEYDFMLSRLEPLFEQLDVPVFRLETDYQYQDVEQLRIRLEAFAEMLEQRTFVRGRVPARRRSA